MLVGRGAAGSGGVDDGRGIVPTDVFEGAGLIFGGKVDTHGSVPWLV